MCLKGHSCFSLQVCLPRYACRCSSPPPAVTVEHWSAAVVGAGLLVPSYCDAVACPDRRRSPLPTCQAWLRMLGPQAPETTFPATSRGKSKSGVRATSSPFLFGGHLAKRWGIPSTKDLVLSGQWGWCYVNNFRDILPGKNHYSKRIYFEPQLCHFKYLFLKAKSLLGELHYLPWT